MRLSQNEEYLFKMLNGIYINNFLLQSLPEIIILDIRIFEYLRSVFYIYQITIII